MPPSTAQHAVDLVCEGGGVKGIGLAGAYAALEAHGWQPRQLAGTSAGAITAALIAAGYTASELTDVVFDLDYRRFEDKTWMDHIPAAGKPLSILMENGIYKGEAFLEWMRGMLAEKGVRTFTDLPAGGQGGKYGSRLQVIASDISARRLLVLPRDASELGLDAGELEVAHAVRMSISIPLYFKPVRLAHPETNQEHLIVDGGILSNFPVWLFDRADGQPPRWPTFGLLLVEPDPKTQIGERIPPGEHAARGPRGLVTLLSGVLHTMLEAHDRLYVEKAEYARTIPIPTLGVGTTEFAIGKERARALFESGRTAAERFLESWDFDAYIAAFRSGRQYSRRAETATQLAHARGADASAAVTSGDPVPRQP